MILRSASLFLFSCAAFTLTGCQNMGNPLGGATRMLEAMGRSVGRLSADAKTDALRLDTSEVERAREAALQGGALPGNASEVLGSAREEQVALVR